MRTATTSGIGRRQRRGPSPSEPLGGPGTGAAFWSPRCSVVVSPGSAVSRNEALDGIVVGMYTYTVNRTQIYLTPEENAALERESIKTGKTKSQLIREAIDEKYRVRPSLEEFMAALNAAAGIWDNPEGEAAVKAIHAGRRAEARQTRRRLKALQTVRPDDWTRALDDASRR